MEKVGIIGLGKMGSAVARRIQRMTTMTVLGYDPYIANHPDVSQVSSIQEFCNNVSIILIFIPHDVVGSLLNDLLKFCSEKHIILECGNTFYKETITHSQRFQKKAVAFADCGISGGIRGEQVGFCSMYGCVGTEKDTVRKILELFCQPEGIVYCGGNGSGHFVKMVHNGIEYAVLQGYAEGMQLIKNSDFDSDLAAVSAAWQHGSIMRSFINELLSEVLQEEEFFSQISGKVGANGTGKWSAELSQEQNIQSDLIRRSVAIREWSQVSGGDFSTKLVALLRKKFGGHPIGTKEK